MSTRGGRNAEIYLRRGADTAWVNLTKSVSRENWPEWSPDGGKIAYQTDKSGRFDIWVMDAQGKNPVQLTEHPDHDIAPAWSADGARIAFTSWRMEAGDTTRGPHLYFMNADGDQEQRLVNSALHTSSSVSWSPDGTKIVYSRGQGPAGADLYLRTLADGAETRLTDSEPYDGGAVFSPDGTQIAFHADRGNGSSIAILGVDGAGYREVVSTGQNWYPRWSPDGKWLVYAAAESAESPNIELCAVPAAGGAPIPVVTGPDREVEGRWRP
jgi:Tol biopolymer transport system component